MAEKQGPFWSLYQELKSGKVNRREFLERAGALGIGMPIALFVLNALKVEGAGAAPLGASKRFSSGNQTAATAPAEGTEGQTRGAGGELKILQWQAVTHLSLHNSTGTKDTLGASLVTEPLMHFLPDGTLVPCLVKEVPSLDNGLLAADLTSVTYNLLEGVLWNDGTPFTSADVKFTWEWILNPENASTNSAYYGVIASIDTPDDLTVKLNFASPNLNWNLPFAGSPYGAVYPKHALEGGADAFQAFRTNPVGTGPYKVESFVENDQVIYTANENYREPNKPFFATVNLKGGGSAESAAQAVFQTGDWEFAWNLQVQQSLLTEMEAAGGKGTLVTVPGTAVERIHINFSDPNKEVNGQRSEKNTPHPFLTDLAVRQALSLATDRDTMAVEFYAGAPGEPAARNILTGIGSVESPNTTYEFNIEKAKQTLEAAGWVMDGDSRKKDGVELKIAYTTTINAVRQGEQAVAKAGWEEAGFNVQLKQVDPGIFFDSSAGNDQNYAHFYSDVQMYTNNPSSVLPLNYMQSWYGGANPAVADGSNIAQKENGWSGVNELRYQNAEYDALYEAAAIETDPEKAAELFIQMNDIVINDVALIPLVQRAAEKYAISKTLNNNNVAGSFFEALYWDIANWNRVAGS
ncbi:MAG: peptide ABC transporter substrate-binding protein [Thermomicrobiales bacterium]|nr:peptide ABC transporter substrate-binding protein [Thermomicrobiales bacterium]